MALHKVHDDHGRAVGSGLNIVDHNDVGVTASATKAFMRIDSCTFGIAFIVFNARMPPKPPPESFARTRYFPAAICTGAIGIEGYRPVRAATASSISEISSARVTVIRSAPPASSAVMGQPGSMVVRDVMP